MKKIFSMLLVVAMLVACLAITASAASYGDTITVEFKVEENPGFASYNAEIRNMPGLKLISITEGDLTKGKGMFYANPETKLVGYAGAEDVTGEGVLFVAEFEVTELNCNTEVWATLVAGSSSNAANEAVTFEIVGGGSFEISCEHEWVFVNYLDGVEPTCTSGALAIYKCSICGKENHVKVDALGHAWGEWTVTKAATCHEEGVETRVCANDPEHTENRAIKKLDHVPGEPVKENIVEATQTTDGSYDLVVYCTLCGDELSRETVIVPALGLDDEPNTGDFTPVLAMFAIVVMMVPCLLVKKFRAVK